MRSYIIVGLLISMAIWLAASVVDLKAQQKELADYKMSIIELDEDKEMLKELVNQAKNDALKQKEEKPAEKKEEKQTDESADLSLEGLVEKYCGEKSALAKRIIKAESNWNPQAKNKSSSASGLFQFIKSSWASYSKKAGVNGDVFDAHDNIKVGCWVLNTTGTSPWNASKSKWQ